MPATGRPSLARSLSSVLRRNPVVFLAAAGIFLLVAITHLAINIIHASHERIISAHLQTSLNAVTEQVESWRARNLGTLQVLRDNEEGRRLLLAVLRENGRNADTRRALEQWIYPILIPIGYEGYAVVSMERRLVAGATEAYLGDPVFQQESLEVLNRALLRQPSMSRPMPAPKPLRTPGGTVPGNTMMQNICILVEDVRQPAGYFCLRFNPRKGFFPIFAAARSGETGEAYGIDAEGYLVTPSRFPHLADPADPDKLLAQRELSARIPQADGGKGPLTRLARRLLKERDLVIETGYLEYRGKAVAGAGRWIDNMNMGVIVEQDLAEAFAPYELSRNVIMGLAGSAILLIVVLTASFVSHRQRLAVREGRFRGLLHNIPTPVYMTDLHGALAVVNPAFCALLKADAEDLLGRRTRELPVPKRLQSLFDDAVQPQAGPSDQVHEVIRPEGSPCYYRIIRFPVYADHSLNPMARATILIDITERALASLRLEQVVEERTAQLSRAKEEAVEASRTKAAFLANMSHEIRTPLNAIIGLAGVALSGPVPDPVRNYLGKIHASGEHLLQVINDILDISRLEAGKLKIDHIEFPLSQVIDRVVDLIWTRADAKGLELRVDIDDRIPRVLVGDPLRLGQILINLTANAVKFTDQGHVSISVRPERDDDNGVELVFEVEDTGIGISTAAISTLFQPFQQVDSSSARRFEGSGLGLAICKNLADLMEGSLDVSSAPGLGSCFRLRIRCGKGETRDWSLQASPRKWIPLASDPAMPCHVLLVEDNAINQELAETLLQRLGAKVTTVSNGQAAVDAVARQDFDIVLMDIQMPEMDGFEATRVIRTLAKGGMIPIVAMTANALPGDRERCLDAGMDDYIAKPIEPDKLRAALKHWCNLGAEEAVAEGDEFTGLQQAGIDTQRALGLLMHDGGLYRRLLIRFVEERAELPRLLMADWQRGDRDAVRNQVHALKSLAGSLGMLELEQAAASLEQRLQLGAGSETDLDNLGLLLREAITLVRAWLYEVQASA